MPNAFAYVVLFGWPFIVFLLFRSMPRSQALIWSIVAGYLLLPFGVAVKFKMIPAFDKDLIPAISAAVMCLIVPERPMFRRRAGADVASSPPNPNSAAEEAPPASALRTASNQYSRRRTPPRDTAAAAEVTAQLPQKAWGAWLPNLLIALLLVGTFATALTNSEPELFGRTVLPGLHLYDAGSLISSALVTLLPYLLGRRYLTRPEDQALLLRILGMAGLLYSLPVLFEIRMSPRLAREIYGFMATPFAMTMRDGGYRPVVFLQNGLWLAIFMAMTALACMALWRHERARDRRTRWFLSGAYIAVVLVLCHSLGALVIFLALMPIVLLASVRVQLIFATAIALVILTYPVLRGSGLIPVDSVYSFVKTSISTERAGSLLFRLKNEDQLLAKADQKPLAGWGGYGRARIYNKNGNDLSVTDGMWIIVIGHSGWIGYASTFGLLVIPIVLLTLQRRRLDVSPATSGLCLVLVANLMDLIPDASLVPVTWLIAGALAGRLTYSPPVAGRERRRAPPAGASLRRELVRSSGA